jgi:hypothetical protein
MAVSNANWGQNKSRDMLADPDRYFKEARLRARKEAQAEVQYKLSKQPSLIKQLMKWIKSLCKK